MKYLLVICLAFTVGCSGIRITHTPGERPEIEVPAVDNFCTAGTKLNIRDGGPVMTCNVAFSF